MTRPWSPVQVKQWSKHNSKKPKDQTREDGKLRGPSQKTTESRGTRSFVQTEEKLTTRAHMQKGEDSRRLRKQHEQQRERTGSKWTQVGWPSPLRGPITPPFDLDASRDIYSPLTKSQGRINSFVIYRRGAEKLEGHHCWWWNSVNLAMSLPSVLT
jgi:hypothetical protein